jgi:hypothetical protein
VLYVDLSLVVNPPIASQYPDNASVGIDIAAKYMVMIVAMRNENIFKLRLLGFFIFSILTFCYTASNSNTNSLSPFAKMNWCCFQTARSRDFSVKSKEFSCALPRPQN